MDSAPSPRLCPDLNVKTLCCSWMLQHDKLVILALVDRRDWSHGSKLKEATTLERLADPQLPIFVTDII